MIIEQDEADDCETAKLHQNHAKIDVHSAKSSIQRDEHFHFRGACP